MNLFLSERLLETGRYCCKHYFSKPYQLAHNEIYPREGTVDGKIVQRPNHALAHTLRKIYNFRVFLAILKLNSPAVFLINGVKLSVDSEAENILTAFFFSVVGRESEISHKDDPTTYAQFRKKSAEAYEKYILENKDRVSEYKQLAASTKLTFYKNLIEAPHADSKALINRLFRACHCLDLLRCYTEIKYSETLESIKAELCLDSIFPEHANEVLVQLKEYAVKCIEATGDRNFAAKTPRVGSLFVACSTSVTACCTQLEKVPLPGFLQKGFSLAKATVKPLKANLAQAPTAPSEQDNQLKYNNAKTLYAQKKYDDAFVEFKKLAVVGVEKAAYMTGVCYYYGKGCAIDYVRALKYLNISAEKNNAAALYMLGIYLLEGKGCKPDLVQSKIYFKKAAENGSLEAKGMLEKLLKK